MMWWHLFASLAVTANISMIGNARAQVADGTLRGATNFPSQDVKRKLIVGGSDASTGRFPYMVSIQKFDEMLHQHAGMLIAPDIVLTTADTAGLIEDLDTASASVHPHLLFDPRDDSERFSIVRQVTHPDYATNEFGFPEHNVRLLKLGGMSSNAWVRLNFDPTVPSAGDVVKLLGWGSDAGGSWQFLRRPYPFDSALHELEGTYITNEHCIDLSQETFVGNLTDNMLCTALSADGSCVKDEGGPMILEGETADEDVVVGIIPLALPYGCAELFGFLFRRVAPQVYGRVSADFNFIRRHVCRLSNAPPQYLQCDPGSAPVEMPSASPGPTIATDVVTVVVHFDGYPAQTAWKLAKDGKIIHEVPRYRVTEPHTSRRETFSLLRGEQYTLEVLDSIGNGMCCKYGSGGVFVMFGAEVDYEKVLAFSDGQFDDSVNATFVVSETDVMDVVRPEVPTSSPSAYIDQMIVTVAIEVGKLPAHVGWSIASSDYKVVMERQPGTYASLSEGMFVEEQVILGLGEEYTLAVLMRSRAGLRQVALYVGDTIAPGNELVFDAKPFARRRYTFVASPNATTTVTPGPSVAVVPSETPSMSSVPSTSLSPTAQKLPVTIEIKLGEHPASAGWLIRSDVEGTVFEVPFVTYFGEAPGSIVRETIYLSRGGEYEFVRTDFGVQDAIRTVFIYLGSEPSSDMLLVAAVSAFTGINTFVVSEDDVFRRTLAPTELPSGTPTRSPSVTMEPSRFVLSVTVVIQYDRYPEEISWRIRTRGGYTLRSGFGYQAGVLHVETVHLHRGRRFVFSIQDSFGDGLCCDYGEGYARLYLGDEVRDDMLMADINPRFGSTFSFDFEPNPNFLIVPTTEPSVAPSTSTPSAIPSASVKPSPAPSKSDAPSVSPAPTRRRSAWCFSSMNTVLVEGRGSISIEDVKIGDRVMVGDGRFETVYSFGHYSKKQVAEFVQLTVSNSVSPLELTREHMVFVEGSRAVPAGILEVGDRLMVESGESGEYGVVRRIEIVERVGVYAPFTASGRIVVNGVVASTFITFGESWSVEIGSHVIPASYQWLAHAFESPHRMYCRLYMEVCKEERYTDDGVSLWVSGGLEVAQWLMSEGNASWTLWLFPVAATALFVVWAAELFFQWVFCSVMLWICLGGCCVWFQHSHRSVLSFKGDRG